MQVLFLFIRLSKDDSDEILVTCNFMGIEGMHRSLTTYYSDNFWAKYSYLFVVLYYLVSLMFIAAGLMKIYDTTGLMKALQQVAFLNKQLIVIVATMLPLLELGLGVGLLLRYKPAVILGLASGLLTVFLMFSIYGFFRGFSGDCGCFGDLTKSWFGWEMITRNFLLVCATGYLWMRESHLQSRPN